MAFDRLDLELVEILHRDGNHNSRRATEEFVEQLGGRHEGLLRNYRAGPDGPDDLHRYTISKAEFEEASKTEDTSK
jgi:RimJ/RimL family protein N-acetyltransferase